jgi:RNA polymerase sigma-B factor
VSFDETYESDELKEWLFEYKKATEDRIKIQLKNLITIACLPFVKKISHSLARRSTDPVEDLVQVGSVGLLKAIEQYDDKQGTSFKTYATYLITGEIRHYLRDKTSMIRAPRELQELSFRINQIIQKLSKDFGRTPSDLEVAKELEIPISRITEVGEIDRRKQMMSLDQVVSSNSENEQILVDKLVDDKYQEFLTNQENRIMLAEAVEMLENTLKEVIKMSFFEDMSQNEIAKRLGISQMQVSRRIRKALSELFTIITRRSFI